MATYGKNVALTWQDQGNIVAILYSLYCTGCTVAVLYCSIVVVALYGGRIVVYCSIVVV